MATYTVVKGDCLWNIAKAKLGSGTRWKEIANLNTTKYPSLKNSTIIQVGWVLELPSGSGSSKKSTASNVAVVEFLGPEKAGEDRTLLLTWSWGRSSETEKYLIEWIYTVEGGRTLYATQTVSVDAEFDEAAYKYTTWSVPDNAVTIKVKVKPVAKKETVNKKETTPWTAGWSTITTKAMYYGTKFPPEKPSAPSVKLDGDKLTMELTVSDYDYAEKVAFQVLEDYKKAVVVVNNVKMTYGHAAYTCKLSPGKTYVARCRVYKNGLWSEYSDNTSVIITRPIAPTKLTAKALSENDIYLEWKAVANVTGYEYQYTTKKEYFDTSSQVSTGSVDSTVHCANLVDLETGNFTYFFRVRAKGEGGESDWSSIVTLTLGKAPAAPTTWSSTTTAIIGKPVNLYWVHNSEDGSSQTFAEIELTVNGKATTITKENTYTDEEDRDNTSVYVLDTSAYSEDTIILWRVRTAGVLSNKYGDWSVQREIDIYAQPTIDLRVTKNLEGEALDDLTSFPFYIEASAGPASQLPVGYHLKIVANEGYETVDRMGNPVIVSAGEAVYSKYFDNNFEINGVSSTSLYVIMTPSNIDLENNISYTLTCTVSMDSGLTAEDSIEFTVAWEDISYVPNAEIGYDPETYSTIIKPHCTDVDGNLVDGIVLSVYRREYDGTFTEIETNIPNNGYTFITDPHPALDYARYRVIAIVEETGAIGFYDIPGYPIGESAAIIQWNEEWSTFDAVEAEPLAAPAWTGSLVRLPYNIDISTNNAKDVALVEYIGREHPVAYYGTHLGETVSLKTDVPAIDGETLYALRRLMRWKGDVYVRLPNGIGHWATVSVQYNENHNDVKIPVSIDITRVEGGV